MQHQDLDVLKARMFTQEVTYLQLSKRATFLATQTPSPLGHHESKELK